MTRSVCVLGARGGMGARVRGLLERSPAAPRVRSPGRREADVRDERALRRALGGAALCVNAVGPYAYDPGPVVRACVAEGCHYADLAERADFLQRAARAARAAGAAAAGVAVVPGASTVPGLAELLGLELARRAGPAARALSAWLALGTRNPLSAGLLVGLLEPVGRPLPEAPEHRAFRGGLVRRRLEALDARPILFGRYPSGRAAGVDAGERRLPLALFVGFDRPAATRALAGAAPLLARLPRDVLSALARAALPALRGVARTGGERGALRVELQGKERDALGALEVVAFRAGLDVPALPALWIAERVAREGGPGGAGVLRLADAVGFDAARTALRGHGIEVRTG